MKNHEIPWPAKGDKAFKDVPFSPTGASPHLLSEISEMFGGDYQWAIVAGFKEAADKVVDSLVATKEKMDVFFFPVVYLYRHAIELALKGLVNDGVCLHILEDGQELQDILGSHNLNSLWDRVRPAGGYHRRSWKHLRHPSKTAGFRHCRSGRVIWPYRNNGDCR